MLPFVLNCGYLTVSSQSTGPVVFFHKRIGFGDVMPGGHLLTAFL